MGISANSRGQRPGVCTSTTRPVNPYHGQIIFETDTNTLKVWLGSAWSTGTFHTDIPPLSVDYLVVAGGGGGGGFYYAGSGGAGGLRSTVGATGGGGALETALSLAVSTNYTVTVGAGGSAGVGNNADGGAGVNSVFSTITSIGGAAGRGYLSDPTTGGCGAGGGSAGT